jgi:hypothetical protein
LHRASLARRDRMDSPRVEQSRNRIKSQNTLPWFLTDVTKHCARSLSSSAFRIEFLLIFSRCHASST